jgi:hypothetical protein
MSSEPAPLVINERSGIETERTGSVRPDCAFVASTGLVSRRIADETILVPVASGVGDLDAVYTLSDVGSRIWTLLQRPVSIDQIVSVLSAEYDVVPEVASSDVTEFVASLLNKGLVVAADREA